jgi:ribosomal protein S18 acetylase RimI-like enzyme
MSLTLTDLDDRPELATAVLRLYRHAGPGRHHAVCGDPAGMGLPPELNQLLDAPGVLLGLDGDGLTAVLACCSYSDEQITLWGPVTEPPEQEGHADAVLVGLRRLLHQSPYSSLRVQVDTRNRWLRAFYLRHGLSIWKDNVIFEVALQGQYELDEQVCRLDYTDLEAARELLYLAFPDSGHFEQAMIDREHKGYRHYGLWQGHALVGAAALRPHRRRSWLSMLAITDSQRAKGLGTRLLRGICAHEQAGGALALGLEVLADNQTALRAYDKAGLERQFTTTILTGPI